MSACSVAGSTVENEPMRARPPTPIDHLLAEVKATLGIDDARTFLEHEKLVTGAADEAIFTREISDERAFLPDPPIDTGRIGLRRLFSSLQLPDQENFGFEISP